MFDDGANVFYGVGAVMDVLVGGVVVFGGDDLVHGIVHCWWWDDRIWGFGSVTFYAGEETNPNPNPNSTSNN